MTEVILRPARAFDAHDCAAIVAGWVAETPWMPPEAPPGHIFRRWHEEVLPRRRVTVAEARGRVVGVLALDPAAGEVTSLFVGPRGRGIGGRLIEAAKAEAPRLTLWTFQRNDGARRFYARHGFVEVETTEGENEERLPDVRLEWAA